MVTSATGRPQRVNELLPTLAVLEQGCIVFQLAGVIIMNVPEFRNRKDGYLEHKGVLFFSLASFS